MKRSIVLIVVLSVFFSPSTSLWAQNEYNTSEVDVFATSARDFGIVAGTTGLGMLFGLSTLSFVKQPEDHLRRILVGGALGIIAGVGVVAYFQAIQGQDLYDKYSSFHEPQAGWSTPERTAWYDKEDGFHQLEQREIGRRFFISHTVNF